MAGDWLFWGQGGEPEYDPDLSAPLDNGQLEFTFTPSGHHSDHPTNMEKVMSEVKVVPVVLNQSEGPLKLVIGGQTITIDTRNGNVDVSDTKAENTGALRAKVLEAVGAAFDAK